MWLSRLSLRAKIMLAILMLSACAIIAGKLTYGSMIQLEEASGWTDHTFIVLIALGELDADLNELETNQRGFLLTGDARYFESSAGSEKAIDQNLQALGALIADNPVQRRNMDRLAELVPARIKVLNRTLEIYKSQGLAPAIVQLKTNAGKNLMDGIHGVLDEMGKEEKRLLQLRRAEEENSRLRNNLTIVAIAGVTLVFLGIMALLIRDDLDVRNRLREATERMALTDSLTGLPNRVAFNERLKAALARATRNQRKFAVLYFDLDGFKAINDRFGHLAGDQVLYQVARRVGVLLRASDTLARLGGDEFVVLIDEVGMRTDAGVAATKIIDSISRPFEFRGEFAQVGASVGISLFPEDDTRPERLIQLADEAMYQAKEAGKARFRFCSRRDVETG